MKENYEQNSDNTAEAGKTKQEIVALKLSKGVFIGVMLILVALVIFSAILALTVQMGAYDRAVNPITGREEIVNGTYRVLNNTPRIAIWKLFASPFLLLGTSDGLMVIALSIFIMVLGGAFNIIEKTGGIHSIVRRLINRFANRKYLLMCIIALFFMLIGSLFGIYEEALVLLPLVLVLARYMKWDPKAGMGMCMLSLTLGFSCGLTNPFSIGLASQIAGTNILSGILFRVACFIVFYALLCGFLILHAKRAEKKAKPDQESAMDINDLLIKDEKRVFNAYLVFFLFVIVVLVVSSVIPALVDYAMYMIGGGFLIGSLIAGLFVTKNVKAVFKHFIKGALLLVPAIPILVLAACVKYILTEGNVIDTFLYQAANSLQGMSPFMMILVMYAIIIVAQFFITSSTGKIVLMVPILAAICDITGVSREAMILSYMFGDGFTNVFFPTTATLLIALSISKISFKDWIKHTALFQLVILILSAGMLLLAVAVGY